jgi:uncharacterized protein YjbI with pentapeptide repeats
MGNTRLKAACGTASARPDFSGIDLRERNFSFHDLSAADLHDADLRACEFWHTNLRGADLSGSDMRGAGLYSSDLSQADLSDVELRNATLANCDFHDADVSSTHWDAAAIVDCDFRGTGLTPDDVLDHMEERDTTYAFARNLFDDGSGYAAEVDYDSEAAYSSATLYAPGYDPEDHDGPLRFLTVSDARGASVRPDFSSRADIEDQVAEYSGNGMVALSDETQRRIVDTLDEYVDYGTGRWRNTNIHANLDTIDEDDFTCILMECDMES